MQNSTYMIAISLAIFYRIIISARTTDNIVNENDNWFIFYSAFSYWNKMPLDLDGHVSTLVLSFILKSQSLSETPLIVTPVFIIGVYQQKKLYFMICDWNNPPPIKKCLLNSPILFDMVIYLPPMLQIPK